MAVPKEGKQKLSKGVLQMKFMQRSSGREQQAEQSAQTQLIDEDHWHLALPPQLQQKANKYISEPSYQKLEELKFGRQSFKGFNPEIERLAAQADKDQDLEAAAQREAETSVTDQQMADRYSSLVGTITKKFSKKRRRAQEGEAEPREEHRDTPSRGPSEKRKKFKKPKDD